MKAAVVFASLMLIASAAHAQEQVPFPELDTPGYCAALVSKMLNPAEKLDEQDRCLAREASLREATRSYWRYLPLKAQNYVVKNYFDKVEHQTYITLQKYVGSAVGDACMITKALVCQPAKN